MPDLGEFRSGKPGFYPDQSIYAEFACAEFGLAVRDIDGGSAFVKPLTGSRGDFAEAIHGEASLSRYLDVVTTYYDAVLVQPIIEGAEYRIFLLDDEVVFSARKYPPSVLGDGVHTVRELL